MRKYSVTQTGPDAIRCGPLTFNRQPNRELESWVAVRPASALTYFSVTNYGGVPSDKPFSGWRVCSAGPFRYAGGWVNRDDAILGATPWLIDYWREQARGLIGTARELEAALDSFFGQVDQIGAEEPK